jgi:hypothetical protein
MGFGPRSDVVRYDTRTMLPDITANRDIEYYEAGLDRPLAEALPSSAGPDLKPLDGPEDLAFSFSTTLESYVEGGGEDQSLASFHPNDGDVITGTDLWDFITSPPGDPTAITIIGGIGEDTIVAGLNDTIITDDDSDGDIIRIDTPASFAQIYDDVPVIHAGPEDVIEVEPADSLVISYAIDRGAGVTDYLYHIVHAPDGFAAPNRVLGAGDSPVSLEDFYLAAGIQLLAVGHLGSLDQSDPANPVDTRIAPPAFDGPLPGFQLAQLTGDTISAETIFTTATAIAPVA